MKKDLEILKALIKEIKQNLREEVKVKGKVVKSYKQNGDKSYTVTYEDDTKDTISVSHDDWDKINDDNKKVNEKKLSKKQQYIAKQAPPEDEINAADFEKLRNLQKEGWLDFASSDSYDELIDIVKKYIGDEAGSEVEYYSDNGDWRHDALNNDQFKKEFSDWEKNSGKPMDEAHQGQDHEVSMANNSLDSILWAANELKKHLGDQERDIPAWIQDHITNAENYIIQAAKNFHDYGQEQPQTPNEMSLQEMIKKVGKKYNVYSKKGKKLGSHPSKKKAQKQMAAIEISKQGK